MTQDSLSARARTYGMNGQGPAFGRGRDSRSGSARFVILLRSYDRGVLTVAYVAAALLEVAGIATVVLDIRAGVRRAETLAAQLRLRTGVSRNTPPDRAAGIAARAAARADEQLGAAISELLRGNIRRRLLGPGLLVAGVIVGTAANIAAL